MSHTVSVTDSGFSDQGRRRRKRTPPPDTQTGYPTPAGAPPAYPSVTPPPAPRPPPRRRRPSAGFVFFLVAILGLVAFAGWAWAGRTYTDDLVAYDALGAAITEMDRSITPLGHSEIPPCRDSAEGLVTRTYPPSTGPQAAELIGYLVQKGWTENPADPPLVAHLTKLEGGHLLTIDVAAPTRTQLVSALTGRSPASSLACLVH